MTGEAESGSPEQVTIMIITTAIEFACGFGLIALLIFGVREIVSGELTMRQFIGLPVSFGFVLATGYRAMMLVCRPTRSGMVGVMALSALSLAIILAMVL